MKVEVEQIKELRDATGAGVLDAKKALTQAEGDFDRAVDLLREKGLARAAKRADREANEGVIEVYSHLGNRLGVMLELNCETDFVARNEQFQELAHDIALHIAAKAPRYLSRDEVPEEDREREAEVLRAQAKKEGKPDNIAEQIVQGRLKKFYEETVLMEQPFVKDESMTVEELINNAISVLGENIVLRRFVRYERGEALD
ncbi:MAG: translation elongation factor Ts [Candidatus Promineifilaceae bacterium]|nr:translation elongation factor Ts [Candidatus Promineifilaceae bacterium]